MVTKDILSSSSAVCPIEEALCRFPSKTWSLQQLGSPWPTGILPVPVVFLPECSFGDSHKHLGLLVLPALLQVSLLLQGPGIQHQG